MADHKPELLRERVRVVSRLQGGRRAIAHQSAHPAQTGEARPRDQGPLNPLQTVCGNEAHMTRVVSWALHTQLFAGNGSTGP